MGAAEHPTPIAEGNLDKTPFAHLLLYVLQRGMSGTLVVWPEPASSRGSQPVGQDRLRFDNGLPIAARLAHPSSSFAPGLLPLFTRVHAPYAFYETDLVGQGPGVLTGRVDSLALIAASLRGAARDDVVASVLDRFGEAPVRVRAGMDLSRFNFDAKEAAFVSYLRAAPAPIVDLVASSGDPRMARRMLYLLAISKAIEPFDPASVSNDYIATGPHAHPADRGSSGDGRHPSSSGFVAPVPEGGSSAGATASARGARRASVGRMPAAGTSTPPMRGSLAPEPVPNPPSDLSEEHREQWMEVARRARSIEQQNYFEMLGVSSDTSAAAAHDAYFKAVKRWHPDRLPAPLAPLRPWADRIFYYLTQAKDVLADDKERAEYAQSVQQGGGTPESDRLVNSIVQAALEYQKAEVLFRRRDYDGALGILDTVKAMSPDESDFHAFEAWVLHHKHPGEGAPVSRMLESVERALKLNPMNEKAHFYKGMILKRTNDPQALACFKRASELNPRNLEAVREVRLATMRTGPKDGGFMSKLFGGGGKKK